MSDELAQEDEDAEDYDLEALESRSRAGEYGDAMLGGRRGADVVSDDAIVFEIGDRDTSDEEDGKNKSVQHDVGRRQKDLADDVERQRLMESYEEITGGKDV